MSLQANIHVPGIVSLAYPYQGQSITSHVRLAGNVIVPVPGHLPQGTDFLAQQLSPADQLLLLPSHALHGKNYRIKDITYYMDGTAVRQVNYVSDKIRTYQFNDDYLSIFYGEQITEGDHVFTILVTAYSDQNPGITIFDSLDLSFFFSTDTNSIKTMLDAMTPSAFMGGADHQIIMYALDYVLTQRTEGAVKNDIDFLASLYDLDTIPSHLLPYLAKTIGYDYFSGLLGNGDSIKEELRFLPDWQKSVGTKESILVLLRSLSLEGKLIPLYLDLQKNVLITGSKLRYAYTDETTVPAQSRQSRLTVPLTHASFVVPSIKCEITDSTGTVVGAFVWDIILQQVVWQTFSTGGWLTRVDGTPANLSDVQTVYADAQRGGMTITFSSALKNAGELTVTTTYLYEVESKPGRNTRLSEFFDVELTSQEAPNDMRVKDYLHAIDIIQRSKPFRTKIRNTKLPVKVADAFVINAGTVSSTDDRNNPDRLSDNNIPVTSTHLEGVADEVGYTVRGDLSDGFLFSWELDCNLFENRFGLYYSLAIEPSLHSEAFRQILFRDTLVQRGHAVLVRDDGITGPDRIRYLRPVDSHRYNFTTEPVCKVEYDYLGHYHTLKHDAPTSPALQEYRDLLISLDTDMVSPSGEIVLFIERLTKTGARDGHALQWDGGSGLSKLNLATGVVSPASWFANFPNLKICSDAFGGGVYTLTLIRPTSQAAVQALWDSRPNLNNYPLALNQWHAIWDVVGDFFVDPVHLSVLSPMALLNHQGTCCGCDIDVFDTSTPATFNQILGKTYQFGYEFDVEVYSMATQDVFAVYRWTSGAWITVLANPDLAVTLLPANTGSLTDDLIVGGTAVYVGPIVAGIEQQWGIRACPKKVGDRMGLNLGIGLTDDFGLAQVHGGRFGLIDDSQSFLGLPWRSLIEHKHDMGGQRMAAFDGYYLRGGDLLSCLTYKITLTADGLTWDSGQSWDSGHTWDFATQFQWDVDLWDDIHKVWDCTEPISGSMTIHHFPKRQVFEFA